MELIRRPLTQAARRVRAPNPADVQQLATWCALELEPAARRWGDRAVAGECSELELALALHELQMLLRKAGASVGLKPYRNFCPSTSTVLVVPIPGEAHLLGSLMAGELFWNAGWDVQCEFPDSRSELGELLEQRTYDAVVLNLSSVRTEAHKLSLAKALVADSRHSRRNPRLSVVVCGRLFKECPDLAREAGADATATGALDLLGLARRLSTVLHCR